MNVTALKRYGTRAPHFSMTSIEIRDSILWTHRMATLSSFASMVPLPSVSKRSNASLRHTHAECFACCALQHNVERGGERGGGGRDIRTASEPDLLLLLFCETLPLVGLLILPSGRHSLSVALHHHRYRPQTFCTKAAVWPWCTRKLAVGSGAASATGAMTVTHQDAMAAANRRSWSSLTMVCF